MELFKDRKAAGQKLALLLAQYRNQEVIVYALPRGGVVVAAEIAKTLRAPLDLIFAHKIAHPYQPEYAMGAISENGYLVASDDSLSGQEWFARQKREQMEQMRRKREYYLQGKKSQSAQNKVAILVDDGLATGLTMQAGIQDLKMQKPKKIIVAVPVAPKSTASLIKLQVDDFVAINIEDPFLGSVGAYYENFDQVEDEEITQILCKD